MYKTPEEWDDYIDGLIDVLSSIELHKVTILTGRNGGGKSMIRKLLPSFLKKKEELKDLGSNLVASISMDRRAGIDAERGYLSMFDRDCEWLPTSQNTLHSVEGLLNQKNRFLVLDEIELGMGEEVQAGLALDINSKMDEIIKNNLGVIVITHSRAMVRFLKHDNFINLEGMSEEEWLNREIVPVSPEELKKRSDELYTALNKRLKKA